MTIRLLRLFVFILAVATSAHAGDLSGLHAAEMPSAEKLRAAVAKSLPLLEAGAKGSMEARKRCFTCHNQCLPVMALTTARERGLKIDAEELRRQLQFTADFLAKNRAGYLEGKGQGGAALTAGYALWTLELGGRKPDETTAAVAEYLLQYRSDRDHYDVSTERPPAEKSLFAASYVALRGLKTFGTTEQCKRIDERTARVVAWLKKTPAADTEDRVFRLWALATGDAGDEEIRQAREELLKSQRPDGGWAQLPEMSSDAYATGTALTALHQAGKLPTSDPAYARGLHWLLEAQLPDGSWHVPTRAKPIQTYYESGYPHGKDQFLSITAAGWATTALALALPIVAADAAPMPEKSPMSPAKRAPTRVEP